MTVTKAGAVRAQVLAAAADGILTKSELDGVLTAVQNDVALKSKLIGWLKANGEPRLAAALAIFSSADDAARYLGTGFRFGNLVENAKTRTAINQFIAAAKGDNFEAWRLSKDQRDKQPGDEASRNAEHYLFAASVIPEQKNVAGKALMTASLALATPAYSAAKAVLPKKAIEKATTGDSVSDGKTTTDPSLNEVRWGLAGVKDGALGGPAKQDDLE